MMAKWKKIGMGLSRRKEYVHVILHVVNGQQSYVIL